MTKHNALTAKFVKQCKQPGVFRDGAGLLLRVAPSGSKRWVLRLVVRGKRRDIGLGSARDVSLIEARERAFELRKTLRDGRDPTLAQRSLRTEIPTFQDAAIRVHQDRQKTWSNGKHQDQWLGSLRNHVFPLIGTRPVSEICSADILSVLSPIWTTKHETARRVRQRMHAVFDWAIVAGHRSQANPVVGVEAALPRFSATVRHHKAMPYSEIPDFIAALNDGAGAGSTRLALQFLICTATRTSEVLGARWAEIDMDERVWTIPAQRMKSRKVHRVPLTKPCLDILYQCRELPKNKDALFPNLTGKRLSNMAMTMLMRRLDRPETVHGFRSSFRDWAAEQTDFAKDVSEAALAHTLESRVERAYRRSDLFEKRRLLMSQWASFLCRKSSEQ